MAKCLAAILACVSILSGGCIHLDLPPMAVEGYSLTGRPLYQGPGGP